MARRAFASEDKLARREVILEAARTLFVAGDGNLPSASQIADAARLAKGTVYLYFRTKEEIFAALLLAGWTDLMAEVIAVFRNGDDRDETVAAFISTYVDYLDRHPELLRLDALGYGVLEQNMHPDALRAFKTELVSRLTEVGVAIDVTLRVLEGRGFRLLMRTYALTRGLWQSTQGYADPIALELQPEMAQLHPDFVHELREGLTEYWRGAMMG